MKKRKQKGAEKEVLSNALLIYPVSPIPGYIYPDARSVIVEYRFASYYADKKLIVGKNPLLFVKIGADDEIARKIEEKLEGIKYRSTLANVLKIAHTIRSINTLIIITHPLEDIEESIEEYNKSNHTDLTPHTVVTVHKEIIANLTKSFRVIEIDVGIFLKKRNEDITKYREKYLHTMMEEKENKKIWEIIEEISHIEIKLNKRIKYTMHAPQHVILMLEKVNTTNYYFSFIRELSKNVIYFITLLLFTLYLLPLLIQPILRPVLPRLFIIKPAHVITFPKITNDIKGMYIPPLPQGGDKYGN